MFSLWDSCFQASLMELLPDLRKFSTEWALFSQNIYKIKTTDIELYSPTPVNKLCGSNLENFPQGQSKLSAKINEVPYKATVSVKRRQLTVILLNKVNLIPGISTEKKKEQNTEDFTVEIVLCFKVELKSTRDRDMEDWKTSKQNGCHFSSFRPFGLDAWNLAKINERKSFFVFLSSSFPLFFFFSFFISFFFFF